MKTLLQLLLVSLTIWGCNSGPQQKPEVDQVHLQHQDSLRLDSMGRAYNTLGGMDFDRGDYEKALKNYLLALDAYEKVNNPGCIAAVKINLGNISFGSKNYERALSYYTEAKEVVLNLLKDTANTLTNKRRLSTLYNNIGLVHKNEGGVEKAFDNYFKGLKLAEEIGNKVKIAEVCNNLGNMLEKNGQYKEALDYYRKSFRFYSEIGNKNGMATVLANIANIRAKKGEYESALENFDEALAMTKEIGDKRVEMEIYERLAQLNMKLENNRASTYWQLYSELLKSILGEENQKQIAQMQVQFETEKKEKENEALREKGARQEIENSRQKIVIYAIIAGALGLLVLVLVAFNAYKSKKRANARLTKQKLEIEIQKKKIEEQKKNMTDSINYAEHIQRAILPKEEIVKQLLPESFILFKPKDVVSGDFYWMIERDSLVFFAACDCTGHGVPGAFMSMMISALLNEAVTEKGLTVPAEIFSRVRSGIKKSFGGGEERRDGMDATLCVLDQKSKKIQFAAANNSLYLVRKGELIEYAADRQPVGFQNNEEKPFSNQEIVLENGDLVYIASDGFQSQFGGPDDKKFSRKKFKNLLASVSLHPINEQKSLLDKTIENWRKWEGKEETEQVDDILVIGIFDCESALI